MGAKVNVTAQDRIEELESIRGIAALLIVFYHIPGWNSLFYNITLIRHADIMVELFFVLSGFVIFKAYANRITSPAELLKFQLLRLGRLYPVHLIFLLAFLFFEIAKYYAASRLGIVSQNKTPFVENNWAAFFQQLLLIQAIFPSGNEISFNGPAWSISVEFYTYLLFGLIALYFGRVKIHIYTCMAILSCIFLVLYSGDDEAFLIRCIAGFFIGCCTAEVSNRFKVTFPNYSILAVICAIVALMQFKPAGHLSEIGVYALTALLILAIVLSHDNSIKKFLRLKVFLWLGTISYSVYMSHSAILWVVNQTLRMVFHKPEALIGKIYTPQLSLTEALMTYTLYLSLVLIVSTFVFFGIEKPLREKSRQAVKKLIPGR